MKLIRETYESIVLAIGFLTRIPVSDKVEFSDRKLSAGLLFSPLVGLLIGLLLCLSSYLALLLFPISIGAGIVLVVYVIITGGLHLDGLGDLGDAIFSGKKGEAFYAIMKDSRLGTGGLLNILAVMFLDYLLLTGTMDYALLFLLPVAGRAGLLAGAVFGNYPQGLEGSAKDFIDGRNIRNSWWMLVVSGVVFYVILGSIGLLILALVIGLAWLLVRLLGKRLDGVTGDMLGALVEYCQLAYLYLAYILFN